MAEEEQKKQTVVIPVYKKKGFWIAIAVVLVLGFFYNLGTSNTEEGETAKDDSSQVENVNEVKDEQPKDDISSNIDVGSKEWLETKTKSALTDGQFISITYNSENNFALIKFNGDMSLTTKMTIKGMYYDIFKILQAIQDGVAGDVDFNVVYPLTDAYGNSVDTIVIKASFKNATIKKINFPRASYTNLPTMADSWWNHASATLTD